MCISTLIFLNRKCLSLIALFLLSIFTIFLFRTKKKSKHVKPPPGPRKLPIIGNLHQLRNSPYITFMKMAKKYGPIMQLQLGYKPIVIISSPEFAKEVMKDHDLECCSRPLSAGPGRLSYNFMDVVFSPYCDYWKEMKKVFICELLSMKRIDMFWYAREEQMNNLHKILLSAYPNSVNLTEEIFNVTDGIVGTIAFGKTYAQLEFKQGFEKGISDAIDMLDDFLAEDFFPFFGRFIDSLTGALAKKESTFKYLDVYFEKIIDQHLDPRRSKPEHEDIVDVLIGLMMGEKKSSFQITRDHVKGILMNVLVGTTATTAVTISWAFAELLRNQRVMKKAQDELRTILGPNQHQIGKDFDRFKYLELIVRETFRKHPPLPLLIPHFCMKQCNIGGYDILPGTTIFINAYAMGRDPKLWDKPEEFCPERFENSEIDYKGSHFELIPFGSGRRICPGLAMGTAAIKHMLANLLYKYDFEMPNGMEFEDFPMEEVAGGLTVHNTHNLIVIAKPHKWD